MTALLISAYRVRGIVYYASIVVVLAAVLTWSVAPGTAVTAALGTAVFPALSLVGLAILLTFLGPSFLTEGPTLTVSSPVHGRWDALNSPATSVPSHGVRAWGQAYAIDLVHRPEGGSGAAFGDGAWLTPDSFDAFGQSVHAMMDGEVVRAAGWHRDHRSRTSTAAVLLMMLEGMVREMGGPSFILGNHVSIRGADGTVAVVAHLARGSLTVKVGDRVRAGQVIGACGNSGNSSEPHVHAQLMDRVSPWIAIGVPMAFADIEVTSDGEQPSERRDTLPATGETMSASPT